MTLELHYGASLKALNTLRVDASAAVLAEVGCANELPNLFAAINARRTPWMALGEGSNVLFVDDFPGVVVQPRFTGIEVLNEQNGRARIRAGAGENWHRFVEWTLASGFRGLENLALIPGTVGAAPVQNIGAYGVELERYITLVHAYDTLEHRLRRLSPAECGFAYRDSRFKRERDRWLITAVEFLLPHRAALMLDYAGVRDELTASGVDEPTAQDVFEAICAIRRRKLPDPALIGNAGSFFKNPIILDAQAAFIRDHHPNLPSWPAGDGRTKLSAAWLIERSGLRGYRHGDAGISGRHALVLVNHGHASGRELFALARHVQETVEARFGVALEPEPRIVAVG